jgi:hypothetical protein
MERAGSTDGRRVLPEECVEPAIVGATMVGGDSFVSCVLSPCDGSCTPAFVVIDSAVLMLDPLLYFADLSLGCC